MVKKELITGREYKFLIELTKRDGLDVFDIANNTNIARYHVYIVAYDLWKKGLILKEKIDRERYFLAKKKDLIKIRDKEVKRINSLFNPLINANPEKLIFKKKKEENNQEKSIKNNFDYANILIKQVKEWSPSMARRLRKTLTKLKKEIRNSSQP
ncbi:MAG: hypothetical protein ACTSW3_07200 [Promethearchaeota archaeon]